MNQDCFLTEVADLYPEALLQGNWLAFCFGNQIYLPFAKANCSKYSCVDMAVVELSKGKKTVKHKH